MSHSTTKEPRIMIDPVPHYPEIVLALNLITTDPTAKFHWLIFVADEHQSNNTPLQQGKKYHAVEDRFAPPAERWAFEGAKFTLATSQSVAAAAVIGRLKDKTTDDLYTVLSRIPMAVPVVDARRERVFSCRVWIREALRTMHKEGFISCPDVDALETEMWGYGKAAAAAHDDETFERAKLVTAVHSRTL